MSSLFSLMIAGEQNGKMDNNQTLSLASITRNGFNAQGQFPSQKANSDNMWLTSWEPSAKQIQLSCGISTIRSVTQEKE
jgi:hypothetical protein